MLRAALRAAPLALVSLCLAAACHTDVVSGLDEAQAQEAMAALSRAGVAPTRSASGEGKSRRYTIVVPAAQAGKAAEILSAAGLPRAAQKGFSETYGAASMIPSPAEEHARFLDALAGEIAMQLERFDAVADATVIVNAPAADPLAPLDAPRPRPTASVLLRTRAGAAPPAEADVKRLVAASVADLAPDAVAVVTVTLPAPPAAAQAYDSLLGIHVATGSKSALVLLLVGALATIAAMGAWVVLGANRRRATV